MAKVRSSVYQSKDKQALLEDVFELVQGLRGKEEVIDFFRELLFDSEIIMLGRRVQIAYLLLAGKTYEEIRQKLKVGINTIAAVRYSLDNGSGHVLKALREINKRRSTR